jgi:alpha-beta hydrolase superfamily lysophospholipase
VRTIAGFGAAALIALAAPLAAAQEVVTSVAQARTLESGDALPITHFYDDPPSLASSQPGALLRQQTFGLYALPDGARAVRILYHSRSAEGRDVVTSAVVLIPAGRPPAGGWPVIAWAHGTSGVARQCAPSLMKDVWYGEEGLMPMLRAGYAVVATDYHGLGTSGVHQYVSKTAQAYDVIYSIPAARAAVPELGAGWAVDGHSQGGLAAWGVAELEHGRHDPGYLGAVAVAPPSHLDQILPANQGGKAASFYMDYMTWAISALTPGFEASDMLSGVALDRYGDVTSRGCYFYAYASFLDDQRPPGLKAGWNQTPAAKRFFTDNVLGAAPIGGPLLVIAGEADMTVPIWAVRATVKSACDAGLALEFRTYPGLDHDPTMDKSTPDQLAWIAARFAGRPSGNDCGR